jgi:formylglycine-generating enzyme required for sulfatase activity
MERCLEWCQGPFNEYLPGEDRELIDGEIGRRVVRAGSIANAPTDARAARRIDAGPADRVHSIGFRLARTFR